MFMIIEGEVLDLSYKKMRNKENVYKAYVGTTYIGQIHKMRHYWSCFCSVPHPFGVVDGFKTRRDALMFLSRMHPFTTDVVA